MKALHRSTAARASTPDFDDLDQIAALGSTIQSGINRGLSEIFGTARIIATFLSGEEPNERLRRRILPLSGSGTAISEKPLSVMRREFTTPDFSRHGHAAST